MAHLIRVGGYIINVDLIVYILPRTEGATIFFGERYVHTVLRVDEIWDLLEKAAVDEPVAVRRIR